MEFDLFLLKSRGIKQGCNFLELSSDAIFNDHSSREGRNLGLKPIFKCLNIISYMLTRTARKHKLSIFTVIPLPEKLYMVNLAIQLGFVPSGEKTVSGFRNCG